jgi:hypothetical protein
MGKAPSAEPHFFHIVGLRMSYSIRIPVDFVRATSMPGTEFVTEWTNNGFRECRGFLVDCETVNKTPPAGMWFAMADLPYFDRLL